MSNNFFSIKRSGPWNIITLFGFKFKFFRVRRKLEYIEKQLDQFINSIKLEDIKKQLEYSNKQLEYSNKQLDKIEITTHTLKFFPFEDAMPKNFYQDFITNDLTKKYIRLVKNLDDESIHLLDKILYRVKQYAKYGQTEFVVDELEYKEILNVVHFFKNPLVLSDEYISINGYCLPAEFSFCSTAVIYKHFIDSIKDKNKIMNCDIIDAGAYIGDSALVLSSHTNGKVHAFEPEAKNFKNLKKTIEINELTHKIIPVKLGLGNEVKMQTLSFIGGGTIGASFNDADESATNIEKVGMTTIDKYVEENNIKVGLIKTDVEGFEQDLLKGAINTIKRDKPVLMISIYHNFSDFFDIKPMIESLNLGYRFSLKKPFTLDYVGDLVLNAEVLSDI